MRLMKKTSAKTLVAFCLTGLFGGAATLFAAGGAPTAEVLLKDAERARGAAKDGISWEMTMESVENGKTTFVRYGVKAKGSDALISTIEPEKKKGENFLFKKGSLLFIKPGLKKPVATSNRQKLMGNTSNGDIATVNYTDDYNSKVTGEEKVGDVDTWMLELKAKTKNVTYDGIKLWITKTDHLAVRADYLNIGGDVAKTALAEYKNTIMAQGKKVPFVSNMVISSAQNAANKTTMTYYSPKQEKLADSVFTLTNAGR